MLILDKDTYKLVFEGSDLSRERVLGLLLVRPVLYKADPGAARAVAVFASDEDALAAWNHVKGLSRGYGLKVKAVVHWGVFVIDLS